MSPFRFLHAPGGGSYPTLHVDVPFQGCRWMVVRVYESADQVETEWQKQISIAVKGVSRGKRNEYAYYVNWQE